MEPKTLDPEMLVLTALPQPRLQVGTGAVICPTSHESGALTLTRPRSWGTERLTPRRAVSPAPLVTHGGSGAMHLALLWWLPSKRRQTLLPERLGHLAWIGKYHVIFQRKMP